MVKSLKTFKYCSTAPATNVPNPWFSAFSWTTKPCFTLVEATASSRSSLAVPGEDRSFKADIGQHQDSVNYFACQPRVRGAASADATPHLSINPLHPPTPTSSSPDSSPWATCRCGVCGKRLPMTQTKSQSGGEDTL